jgi:hypothetical protein
MVTRQQQADFDLAEWQELKRRGLTPEQRIETITGPQIRIGAFVINGVLWLAIIGIIIWGLAR